jgi:CubicO group peptidase (beta-lactamase class C family)
MYQKRLRCKRRISQPQTPPIIPAAADSHYRRFVQFAQLTMNGGELGGKRLLSPRTVERWAPLTHRTPYGRARGEAWGLSVRVITDAVARNTSLSNGSFGWQGAFGTHFWVDPKEKLVGILMVQTSNQEMIRDFENAVLQSLVE